MTREPEMLRLGRGGPVVAVIGAETVANRQIVDAWCRLGYEAAVMAPSTAAATLSIGDVALARLDVLPTLDGVEPGLELVAVLEARGVRVVNTPAGLVAVHDKLITRDLLTAAGVPHPRTTHVRAPSSHDLPLPCVVKPRFGSWGRDVFRCQTAAELERTLLGVSARPWYRRHGALVQELLPSAGHDIRVLCAGGRVVGAARRVAAPGEWRTNVTLGGSLEPLPELDEDIVGVSLRATAAVGIDFACVDVLPTPAGPVVLELNGAADFDSRYSCTGADVYEAAAAALRLPHADLAPGNLREVALSPI